MPGLLAFGPGGNAQPLQCLQSLFGHAPDAVNARGADRSQCDLRRGAGAGGIELAVNWNV